MGIFPNAQGQVTPSPWSDPADFEPIRDIMGFLVACKNIEDPIKNEGARVITTLFITFSDAQGQLTLESLMESCRNSNSCGFLLLVLLSARMKKIHP